MRLHLINIFAAPRRFRFNLAWSSSDFSCKIETRWGLFASLDISAGLVNHGVVLGWSDLLPVHRHSLKQSVICRLMGKIFFHGLCILIFSLFTQIPLLVRFNRLSWACVHRHWVDAVLASDCRSFHIGRYRVLMSRHIGLAQSKRIINFFVLRSAGSSSLLVLLFVVSWLVVRGSLLCIQSLCFFNDSVEQSLLVVKCCILLSPLAFVASRLPKYRLDYVNQFHIFAVVNFSHLFRNFLSRRLRHSILFERILGSRLICRVS